jgi:hypothetical protein
MNTSSPSPGAAIIRSRVCKLAAVAGMTVVLLGCSAGAASADPWGADASPSSYGNSGWGKVCYRLPYMQQ